MRAPRPNYILEMLFKRFPFTRPPCSHVSTCFFYFWGQDAKLSGIYRSPPRATAGGSPRLGVYRVRVCRRQVFIFFVSHHQANFRYTSPEFLFVNVIFLLLRFAFRNVKCLFFPPVRCAIFVSRLNRFGTIISPFWQLPVGRDPPGVSRKSGVSSSFFQIQGLFFDL